MTRQPHYNPAMRGFTLLEVIVVLVIISLISLVMMQGMTLVLNMRNNLGAQIVDIDQEALRRSLVLQPIEGIVPDFAEGEYMFKGNEEAIAGLTLKPLLRRGGRPIPFSLRLTYDNQSKINTLIYQEDEDAPIELTTWEGEPARFQFLVGDTDWTAVWPAEAAPVLTDLNYDIPPQVPDLVSLQTNSVVVPEYTVALFPRKNRIPKDPPIMP
ncbi:MAG: prepilin-type N-terminal cleavage/methylation domain-containing protein [Rhodospirillaceae bacterium]|nr:prepilin-type N-terminal cleavage/methylation domain-containing protein [Rhodospirillaceae bacterium]